jgi:hypothetical protein
LGFTLPSTAYLIGVVIFGIVGYVAYRYGKKMSLPAPKWIGIALMLYPYAISATWLLYVVGAGLCVGAYLSAARERAAQWDCPSLDFHGPPLS